MSIHPIVEELRNALPPIFAGPLLDELTGGAICWGTIQNKRSRGEIPAGCFARSGSGPTLVIRDPFLAWWTTTLIDARLPIRKPPKLSGRRSHPPAR
jgi:hypothetical protein